MMDFDQNLCTDNKNRICLFILTNKFVDLDKILDCTDWDSALLYPIEEEKHLIKFGKTLLGYNDAYYEEQKNKKPSLKQKVFDIFAIVTILSFTIAILIFTTILLAK